MKRTFTVFGLTLLLVAILDIAVAFGLNWAERTWRFGGLVQYFEYGRSVPGKLAKWQANPNAAYNLFNVGWREDGVARSATEFKDEAPNEGPVIRSYGNSFVNNIVKNAAVLDPGLRWDDHAGPGVPPNYTYAYFEDDRANRRPGDVVVLGILSSTLPAMAAFSNQTWAFEQPAPLTYPIYQPEGDGLLRIDPLVTNAKALAALKTNPEAASKWQEQLAEFDAYFSLQTHGIPGLDKSPFARLIRRSAATSHVGKTKTAILNSKSYPYDVVLQRMISAFARTAREDNQIPIVMLIQDRASGGVDVLSIAKPILDRDHIKYFATAEHYDSKDPSGFESDGHFTPEIDRQLGGAFLAIITN